MAYDYTIGQGKSLDRRISSHWSVPIVISYYVNHDSLLDVAIDIASHV